MFKNLDICWNVSKCPPEENIMDLAFQFSILIMAWKKDIGAMYIRFGNNTKLEGIINVMGDTHGKTMS